MNWFKKKTACEHSNFGVWPEQCDIHPGAATTECYILSCGDCGKPAVHVTGNPWENDQLPAEDYDYAKGQADGK